MLASRRTMLNVGALSATEADLPLDQGIPEDRPAESEFSAVNSAQPGRNNKSVATAQTRAESIKVTYRGTNLAFSLSRFGKILHNLPGSEAANYGISSQ